MIGTKACALLASLVSVALLGAQVMASQGDRRSPQPQEAVGAIIDAFATHDLVALSDAHGDSQAQDFLRRLVQAPGFADAVDDLVVEFGNARYQGVVDRYARGDNVPLRAVQAAWQNVVTPNQVWADEAFFETVRGLNARRPPDRRLRVLLGDPPIDWATVRTREEFVPWLAMRDSFPAAMIQVEVLAKRRKALVVYGHLHFQRRQIQSNFEMSDWRMQTIVSLIERSTPQRVFTIWRIRDELASLVPDSSSFSGPTLMTTRGTSLGAADVTRLSPAWTKQRRMAVHDGNVVPIPEDRWQALSIEEQLDAVLHPGPGADRAAPVPARACAEPGFLEERLRRIRVAGIPPVEAERVKAICGSSGR
ncbi:MAG: hypothetical protein ACT4QD_21660 [Acidobacteriota bacterium]